MDSSGVGVMAAPATPLPANPYTQDPSARLTLDSAPTPSFQKYSLTADQHAGISLDTPLHRPSLNHFQPSNVRSSLDNPQALLAENIDATDVANTLANGTTLTGIQDDPLPALPYEYNIYDQYNAALDTMVAESVYEHEQDHTQYTEEDDERDPMQAYAKISLPDGDYFVTSFQLIIGRDMDYYRDWVREQKRAQRAQQALEEYALEPSQPSQPDVDAHIISSSKSSHSLVGRPAKALPSNYSELGGAVSYTAHSDGEQRFRRSRRQRKILKSKSSSTTSVAPASLHPNMAAAFGLPVPPSIDVDANADEPICQHLGIHPRNRDDIRFISKEHLLFTFNFDEERWELHVLGNMAFVNNVLHKKGTVIPLEHGDNIIVTSLSMDFKLPENYRQSPGISRGTFADSGSDAENEESEQESAIGTSPARRLSNAFGTDDSEEDEQVESTQATGKPKLKLKLKSKPPTDKTKEAEDDLIEEKPVKLNLKSKRGEKSEEMSPEVVKKPGKGKKPKLSGKEPGTEPTTELIDDVKEEKVSPPVIPVVEPGSIFEGVAAEELPQKRKGPGRPPKNGLISKRDQSFVKRKLKEYEKRGQVPPPMDELVAIVRAENKAKELAAKAAARGEAPPDMSVMESIEGEAQIDTARLSGPPPSHMLHRTSESPTEPARKSSPKPKRIMKSPSPMKPEAEYTEEEMKKPTVTYVHILDEVLRDHPIGKADLQEIYDRICKRYPYFRYRVNTAGWQSSVRHNLLQHDRFVENGRSGKGRLWTINYDCPIDKEKKRRITPPPRPQMPMQNGNFPPGQMPYGQPGLNNQASANAAAHPGSAAYYSPYAPSHPNHPGPYGPNAGQNRAPSAPSRHGSGAPQPHAIQHQHQGQQQRSAGHGHPQQAPQQQRPANPPQFQGIVDEIMVYRSRYLSRFQPESDAFKQHDELFRNCTTYISNIFHGTSASVEGALKSEEERKVFKDLEEIFARYQHLRNPPATQAPPAHGGGGGIGQAVGDASDDVGDRSAPAQPAQPAQLATASDSREAVANPDTQAGQPPVTTQQHGNISAEVQPNQSVDTDTNAARTNVNPPGEIQSGADGAAQQAGIKRSAEAGEVDTENGETKRMKYD